MDINRSSSTSISSQSGSSSSNMKRALSPMMEEMCISHPPPFPPIDRVTLPALKRLRIASGGTTDSLDGPFEVAHLQTPETSFLTPSDTFQQYAQRHRHEQQERDRQEAQHHEANNPTNSYSQFNHLLGSLHQERRHRTMEVLQNGFPVTPQSTWHYERNNSLSSLSTFSTQSAPNGNSNNRIMRPKKLQTDSRLF